MAAAVGVRHKLTRPLSDGWLSTLVYVLLGWAFVFNAREFFSAMAPGAVSLLIAGCLFFSIGACFHAMRNVRFHNTLWHVCVLAGAGCHYALIFRYCVAS